MLLAKVMAVEDNFPAQTITSKSCTIAFVKGGGTTHIYFLTSRSSVDSHSVPLDPLVAFYHW